jgi:AcrR family transcriptional regulator
MNVRSPRTKEKGQFHASRRDASALALMEAAESVIAEKGYEGATMQSIALRAGCAAGTTYLYFESKEELFHAMVTRHVVALSAEIRAVLAGGGKALQRLEATLGVIVAYFNGHRDFFRIFYTALPGGRAHVESNLRGAALHAFQDSRRRQIEVVRAGQREGSIRRDLPAEELVDFLHAVNMVTFARWAVAPRAPAPKDQIELLWSLELGGLSGTRAAK